MTVAISLLGPFRVRIDDRTIPTAAWTRRDPANLVKVLALHEGRQMHREQVVDLLWPDLPVTAAAPRLHKAAHFARKVLDCPEAIVLRGEMVYLLPQLDVDVDVLDYEEMSAEAFADGSRSAAESVLDRFPEEPLPGDVYAEWAQELRERFDVRRERLLRQARRWQELVEREPTDEDAHLELVRDLVRCGDVPGALRQYERMEQILDEELGVEPSEAAKRLRAELERVPGAPSLVGLAEEGRLEQEIRFCRARDGVTLAYACSGTGPPLLKAANWLTHVDHDWRSPVWRHWLVELSRRHRLIRYDERGCGLSDWEIDSPTHEDWVLDLETVADESGLEQFDLLGISQGAGVAVTYAARHPERVRRLVLYGGYAQGRMARAHDDRDKRMHGLQVELAAVGWGTDDPAFRQVFTAQFMPDGSKELWSAFNELQRQTTPGENAARVLDVSATTDVVDVAPLVRAPTLVLHARDDRRPPFDQGRLLASLIPDSRFVALESSNHILLADEPAWPVFLAEVEAFLAAD
ncbi:MAG TPA: alpha/beta fold hydrolase [Nocardioidaceae bacterium]